MNFPGATMKNIFDALWGSTLGFANILFVTHIMKSIEQNNMTQFRLLIIVFSVYVVVFWSTRVWLRKWGFVTFRHKLMAYLYHKYAHDLFLFENSSFELIGTGKIASTYDKGISQWTKLLHTLVRNSTHLVVTGLVMVYVIVQADPRLLLVFVVLVALSLTLNRYIARFSARAKQKRIEIIREADRHIVRMAMSKFEVLQNGRIEKEARRIEQYINQMGVYAEPLERYSRLAFAIPSIAIDFMKLGLYFFIGMGIFMKTQSVANLVGVVALIAVIERSLQYLTDTLDQFQQEFIFVRKFWELFDSTPRLQ